MPDSLEPDLSPSRRGKRWRAGWAGLSLSDFRAKKIVLSVLLIPIIVPHVITAIAMYFVTAKFGLIGNVVLLILYLLLIGRGMMITVNASTLFARLIAGAITLMFFTYAFVNMGMVSGVLPVVGVPLPLVSYGGTAMVSLFIGLGVLMSVQAHRKLIST